MEQVLVAGDTHGDLQHWHYLLEVCQKFDIKKVVQVGDFRYWEHNRAGIYYLDALNKWLAETGITLYWLRGNHENHPLLYLRYMGVDIWADNEEWSAKCHRWNEALGPWTPTYSDEGFVKIRENIWFLPDGVRWQWGKATFMAVGGAYSIDKDWCEYGTEWWPQEEVTWDSVNAIAEEPVDVLFTHDVPTGVLIHEHMLRAGRRAFHIAACEEQRHRLAAVCAKVRPRFLFHGHWHLAYAYNDDIGPGPMRVQGLGCNGMKQDSWTIFTIEDTDERVEATG